MEEKYGKAKANGHTANDGADDDSSSEESEDDDGELATQELDDEIFATLQAIKSKDPRLYEKDKSFYRTSEQAGQDATKQKKDKPVTLKDYHRQNLVSDMNGREDMDEGNPLSYDAEQKQLKDSLINGILEASDDESDDDMDEDDKDGFFKAKSKPEAPKPKEAAPLDLAAADNDPERYLTNFMASRAWVPEGSAKWQPFESDDEDEMAKADKFEEAYNLRFEEPNRANETLLSHSRKTVADYSVRREKANPRKRARDADKSRKEEERRIKDEEKARLRSLKLEQASKKLKEFKKAAGLGADGMAMDQWNEFLDAGWDSDKWDKEMQQRFGDNYYADRDAASSEDDAAKSSKKLKKPKWDDDIAIGDIVPDFEEGDNAEFSLSEEDEQPEGQANGDKAKDRKAKARDKAEKKRDTRKERRKLEEAVDKSLATEILPASASSKRPSGPFRYRDTSPTSFGLNAHDILMAEDSSLNQFAGLKKLATFRDPERKKKDTKRLSKKANLRQWRKETFGDEAGPTKSFQEHVGARMPDEAPAAKDASAEMSNIITAEDGQSKKKKHKKRSRKRKLGEVDAD